MTVQELTKALSPMGYTVEDTEDVVRIIVDPSDFIRGAPKFVQTIEQRGGRDVGQVPASARLSGTARISENAKGQETEADGTGRRDIHTAITILRR